MKNKQIIEALKNLYYEEKYKFDPKAENNLKWHFSDEFSTEMEHLIKKQKKASWKYTNTITKRIVIAIISFLIIISTTMAVPAIRKPVVDFIVNTYREFTKFAVDNDTVNMSEETLHETINDIYMPQNIPDEYTQTNYFANEFYVNATWENKNGEFIDYSQNTTSFLARVNTEKVELKNIEINNILYYYYEQGNSKIFLWNKNGYYFLMNVPNSFANEEIIKILESVKILT